MNDRLHQNVSGRDGSPSRPTASCAAFTLIEMMVVVALIGILIGGVFRLIGTAGERAKRSSTVDRLQRIENAISGFYAQYGTYPPVPQYGKELPDSANPFKHTKDDYDYNSTYDTLNDVDKFQVRAIRASRTQPAMFEFPPRQSMDDDIPALLGEGIQSANQEIGGITDDESLEDKPFRYGLMSFLLPRLLVMNMIPDKDGKFTDDGNKTPAFGLFTKKVWNNHNQGKNNKDGFQHRMFSAQYSTEIGLASRILPNFERMILGGSVLLGINTADPAHGYPKLVPRNKIGFLSMTVNDGYGNEIYYYSAPPHQSYRIWSAGPDGKTFPPWIPLDSLNQSDRNNVNRWISDDIARFDR